MNEGGLYWWGISLREIPWLGLWGRAPLLRNTKDEVFEKFGEWPVNGPPSPYGPCWGHYDPHGLNNTLYFLVYTFLTPWRFTVFATLCVSGVQKFKYMRSGLLCHVVSLSSRLFVWFIIYGMFHVWFLSLVVKA